MESAYEEYVDKWIPSHNSNLLASQAILIELEVDYSHYVVKSENGLQHEQNLFKIHKNKSS